MSKQKIEIGDLVRLADGSRLAHGYRFAVVACVSPFIMVSPDGHMLWQKSNIKEMEQFGRSGVELLQVALRRYHSDQDSGLAPKPRKRRAKK